MPSQPSQPSKPSQPSQPSQPSSGGDHPQSCSDIAFDGDFCLIVGLDFSSSSESGEVDAIYPNAVSPRSIDEVMITIDGEITEQYSLDKSLPFSHFDAPATVDLHLEPCGHPVEVCIIATSCGTTASCCAWHY